MLSGIIHITLLTALVNFSHFSKPSGSFKMIKHSKIEFPLKWNRNVLSTDLKAHSLTHKHKWINKQASKQTSKQTV